MGSSEFHSPPSRNELREAACLTRRWHRGSRARRFSTSRTPTGAADNYVSQACCLVDSATQPELYRARRIRVMSAQPTLPILMPSRVPELPVEADSRSLEHICDARPHCDPQSLNELYKFSGWFHASSGFNGYFSATQSERPATMLKEQFPSATRSTTSTYHSSWTPAPVPRCSSIRPPSPLRGWSSRKSTTSADEIPSTLTEPPDVRARERGRDLRSLPRRSLAARPGELESPTGDLEGRCSIQLSYGRSAPIS